MGFLRHTLVGVLLGALTLGALGWAGLSVWTAITAVIGAEPEPRARRETVAAVRAVHLAPGRAVPVIEAFGTVRSTRTLELRAAADGQVAAVAEPFRDGARAAAGDVLVRLDPSEAEAATATARADLAEAEAEARDAAQALELARDDLAVTQEQADLRAQALTRQNDLAERGVGSVAAVEEAALAAAQARQTVVTRRQSLADAEARLARAAIARDRAAIALREAERQLAETTLTAPFDGVLADVTAVPGGRATRGDLLARLVDPEALEVEVRLSTAQFARLAARDAALAERPVQVSLDLGETVLLAEAGPLRDGALVAEGESGRALFARLADPGGFRPGDIVTVRIAEPPLDDVARLPASSVGPSGEVLLIGADGRLREERVEIARREGDTVLVRAGALAGARLVVDRTPVLGAGLQVRVIEPTPEPLRSSLAPDPVALTPERRARLIALLDADPSVPGAERVRLRALLDADRVPAAVIDRIERGQGG